MEATRGKMNKKQGILQGFYLVLEIEISIMLIINYFYNTNLGVH
jgi:hypothetical protein